MVFLNGLFAMKGIFDASVLMPGIEHFGGSKMTYKEHWRVIGCLVSPLW